MLFGLHLHLDRKYFIDIGSRRNLFLQCLSPIDHIVKVFEIYDEEYFRCRPCVNYWCGVFIIRYLSTKRDNLDCSRLRALLNNSEIFDKVMEVQNGYVQKETRKT